MTKIPYSALIISSTIRPFMKFDIEDSASRMVHPYASLDGQSNFINGIL